MKMNTKRIEKQREKIRRSLRRKSRKFHVMMTEEEEAALVKEQEALQKSVQSVKLSSTLRQVWYLLSGSRKKLPWLFFCMIVNSFLGLVGIGLIIPFVVFLQNADAIYSDQSNAGIVVQYTVKISRVVFEIFNFSSSNQLVIFFALAFLVMYALRTVVSLIVLYIINLYTAHATKNLSERIYTVILYMSYSYYLGRSAAQTLFSMSLSGKAFGIIMGLLSLINDLLFVMMLGLGVTLISPGALLISCILALVALVTYKLVHRELRRISHIELALSKKRSMTLYQGVHNFTFSRLFSAEPFFLRIFHLFYNKTISLGAYKSLISSLPRVVLELCVVMSFVGYATVIIIYNPERATEILTTAAVFAAAVFKIMPAMLRITGYLGTFAGDQIAVNEFYEEYHSALHHKVEEVPEDIESLPFENAIEVHNVSFSYPVFSDNGRSYSYENSMRIVRDISFSILKGKKIGIVGGSGGGKTTILHILMAFLNPTAGTVKVDGIDISNTMRRWQKNIGYVPQEVLLMEDSVINNIAFGMSEKDVDREKVTEVLKVANLWSFVQKMPQGMDTAIGEHGKRLSGGQRQRLGIARALYRDPAVFFFDEATSHLDIKTEREVQNAIDNLPSSKTIIIVAHRIHTLASCDYIYKFDEGSITFEGSYDALCKVMNIS